MSMVGKFCLITGATTGHGKALADMQHGNREASINLSVTPNTSKQTITRRLLIAAMLVCAPTFEFGQPMLGDEEWIRQLHRFVKIFNEFLSAIDDGKFDLPKWEQSRSAWSMLDVERSKR
jgi:hypothetical protein